MFSCKANTQAKETAFLLRGHRMVIKFSQQLEGGKEIAHSKERIHFSHN